MIPFLLKKQLADKYGEDFHLPLYVNLLLDSKSAYQGSEHDLQRSFFEWLSFEYRDNPYLYLAHAIPNGGTRNKIEAGRLKAEGVKAGIPDVFIPIPKQGFNGIYIEFKVKTNKPSEDQRIMMLMLMTQGYKVICVNDLNIAKQQFNLYMYG